MQLGTDSQVAELSVQAQLHALEAERAVMVKEENAAALAQCQRECEKQQKKLEVRAQTPQISGHTFTGRLLHSSVLHRRSQSPPQKVISENCNATI